MLLNEKGSRDRPDAAFCAVPSEKEVTTPVAGLRPGAPRARSRQNASAREWLVASRPDSSAVCAFRYEDDGRSRAPRTEPSLVQAWRSRHGKPHGGEAEP